MTGLVEGQRGRAVIATGRRPAVVTASHYPKPAPPGHPFLWITDSEGHSRTRSSQLIEVAERPAPAQVAAALGLASGKPAIMRHQLLLLDDEPAELVWSYYPVALARGTTLAESRLLKGGSPAVLAALGFPPRHAVDQIGTRFATVAEFVALRLPEDIPVLRQFRVVYTDGNRPVEATIMIKAGQQVELRYELPDLTE